MRNKKAENQVKQALEMHPMSEAISRKKRPANWDESIIEADKPRKPTRQLLDEAIEAAAPTESVLSSLKIDSVESLERHIHTYLVSEYKLVIRDGKQTVLKAVGYRCSTCLEVRGE